MDWEQPGTVAVWVGNFPSRERLETYLRETIGEDADAEKPFNRFAADAGFGFYDHDRQEAERFDEALPIGELLAPFSCSASFAPTAADSGAAMGISAADTAILLFDCNYERRTAHGAPVIFVGNFKYERFV